VSLLLGVVDVTRNAKNGFGLVFIIASDVGTLRSGNVAASEQPNL
jgi:hypothetical protein